MFDLCLVFDLMSSWPLLTSAQDSLASLKALEAFCFKEKKLPHLTEKIFISSPYCSESNLLRNKSGMSFSSLVGNHVNMLTFHVY